MLTKDRNTVPGSGLHHWFVRIGQHSFEVTIMHRFDAIAEVLSGVEVGPFAFNYKHKRNI